MLPCSFLLYICQFNLFVNLLLLLLLIVLGCFNFNTGKFGSVKLKDMKIMLYMLPHCFFLYVCQFNLFVNLLLLLLLIVLGCFKFNTRTFGSVKLKEMKIMLYMLPRCFICQFNLFVNLLLLLLLIVLGCFNFNTWTFLNILCYFSLITYQIIIIFYLYIFQTIIIHK